VQSPNKLFCLLISVLIALTWACSSGQLPEQRVHASTDAPQQDSATVTAIVKARKANLRDQPSPSAAVIATVNRGDLLSLADLKPTGPWYQIRETKTGSQGWIHGNTIDLLQTAATNPASKAETTRPRTVSSERTTSPQPPTPQDRTSTDSSAPTPSGRTYVNVDGIRVRSPVFTDTKPEGASARCRDGSYSFSLHRRGTCSHHGGVAEWY
jgi:SH3-like domain-containing protein